MDSQSPPPPPPPPLSDDMQLLTNTETNLINLQGMIALKNKINKIASTLLKDNIMEDDKYNSFEHTKLQDSSAESLDALFEEAQNALPVFTEFITTMLTDLGLNPDHVPMVAGEPIIDGPVTFKVFTPAPLKGRKRTEEKVANEYDGNHVCMLDLVRCSIVVDDELSLGAVLSHLLTLDGCVVRLKNRFKKPLFTGIRDCLLNIKVAGHICEVQLHLSQILKEKPAMHEFYNFFRDMFAGASYELKMNQVESLGKLGTERGVGEGSVSRGVAELLKSRDVEQLSLLADVCGLNEGLGLGGAGEGFGDVKLEVVIRRRILDVLEGVGSGASEEDVINAVAALGLACSFNCNGMFFGRKDIEEFWEEQVKHYRRALEGYERVLGPNHVKTLEFTWRNLMVQQYSSGQARVSMLQGLVANATEKLGKHHWLTLALIYSMQGVLVQAAPPSFAWPVAKQLLEECLEGQREVLGDDNKSTLKTWDSLGRAHEALQQYEKSLECYLLCLKGKRKLFGKTHPQTLMTIENLAFLYSDCLREHEKAFACYDEAISGSVLQLGKEDHLTRQRVNNYALDLAARGGERVRLEKLRGGFPWIVEVPGVREALKG
jgi:tetratricopeptide (TPR) repeat protein